jgi:hypothetical protein
MPPLPEPVAPGSISDPEPSVPWLLLLESLVPPMSVAETEAANARARPNEQEMVVMVMIVLFMSASFVKKSRLD